MHSREMSNSSSSGNSPVRPRFMRTIDQTSCNTLSTTMRDALPQSSRVTRMPQSIQLETASTRLKTDRVPTAQCWERRIDRLPTNVPRHRGEGCGPSHRLHRQNGGEILQLCRGLQQPSGEEGQPPSSTVLWSLCTAAPIEKTPTRRRNRHDCHHRLSGCRESRRLAKDLNECVDDHCHMLRNWDVLRSIPVKIVNH